MFLTQWSLKIWHERGSLSDCHLTRSVISSDKSVQTFWRRWQFGYAHVRRCPNWQCWRDSESGLRETERGTEKKEKGGKDPRKIKQTHAERLAPWGPKAGHGNWPRVGALSLSMPFETAILYMISLIQILSHLNIVTTCIFTLMSVGADLSSSCRHLVALYRRNKTGFGMTSQAPVCRNLFVKSVRLNFPK